MFMHMQLSTPDEAKALINLNRVRYILCTSEGLATFVMDDGETLPTTQPYSVVADFMADGDLIV